MDIKQESAHKVDSGEENSLTATAGFELTTFRSRARHSYRQTILALFKETIIKEVSWGLLIAMEFKEDEKKKYHSSFSAKKPKRNHSSFQPIMAYFVKKIKKNQWLKVKETQPT